jgi:hypothetical protein
VISPRSSRLLTQSQRGTSGIGVLSVVYHSALVKISKLIQSGLHSRVIVL